RQPAAPRERDAAVARSLPYPTRRRLLTAREEVDLAQKARTGDPGARQTMMEANIRLVMSVARRYHCKSLTFEDLVQEGILGLLEAIQKFDGERGNRFSTYATYWIRQAVVRAIEKQDRLIRLPVYGCDAARKVERAERTLTESLGRSPSLEEIAQEAGVPLRLVQALAQHTQDPVSLDAMVGEQGDTQFADLVSDRDAVDPADVALRSMDRDTLLAKVRNLDPRERWILEKRYGLLDGEIHTLKEIAEQLKMSREGVRHVQIRALRKLREALSRGESLPA
ncbi:MAG: sigma-70 family RNA polymerase sigma factor, partial [Armatimonadetes bacterium]|nr:sigma-70 family RNA polymerase sigma factor [Armatimonadota bacterium]